MVTLLSNKFHLCVIFWVELKDSPCPSGQSGVERGEECCESFGWSVIGFVRVAEPLQSGNGDGAIGAAGTKTQTLP